ncbi:GMC oxidoreductase [Hydnomerulius pinastri MD-312]|uniref:GMC oxidoreductase n=1 Tax=Hydnomerulius pinastri MD-312 TaxID=994086 RepID=A0A0C9WFJ0_9AGAM|nr:GMC oxidoreductase [Hydnomerulius pinastri MD-312]
MGASFSQSSYVSDASTLVDQHYDYIIVGGGTAGCVLASRLSEDPSLSVLLVEAGGSHEKETLSKIPLAAAQLLKSQRDWCYMTEPQSALNGRKINYARGKMLGGSASINALVYQHCSPSDFDEWESKGLVGWGYSSLAPYLRKSEKFTPNPLYPVDIKHRGTAGVWHTTYGYTHDICDKWMEAAQAVGITRIPDFNTPQGSLGVTKFVTFVDQGGQRSSPATAFLTKDVLKRKNLTVLVNSLTTRILFSDDGSRAIGIEVAAGETSPRYQISASREIILAAGAVNSPQLLMLSGIGHKEELGKLNIPVVKHLPHVGKNLLDHPMVPVIFRAKDGYTLDYMQNPIKAIPVMLRWFLTGTGPATSNGGEAVVFVRSDDKTLFNSKVDDEDGSGLIDNTSGPDAPDLEIGIAPASFRPLPRPKNGMTLIPILVRPVSTGYLSLVSSSPFDKPSINPEFLVNPADMSMMKRGVRLALRTARGLALKPMLDLKPDSNDTKDIYYPGDADPETISNADLEEWIRNNCETVNHCAGTARMGTSEEDSVVDHNLKVWGINNLRVVDASVFPTMVSGHPTAPVVAIAERMSDLITKDTK